jgi:hypothetical protein
VTSLSGALAVGARRACVACRLRQVGETCARCGGATIDLASSTGERTLAAICSSQPAPVRTRAATAHGSFLLRVFLWGVAVIAAMAAAMASKKIDAKGFIPKDVLTALFAFGGLVAGRILASIALMVTQLVVIAVSGFSWLVASLALLPARSSGAGGSASGWRRFVIGLRTRARNIATAPFGTPRVTPHAAPLGPVLEPLAIATRDEASPTCEGTLLADGDAEIDAFTGSILGVEGRTHGTDVADATIAPFRIRTDDGAEIPVRIDAGRVYFADRPLAVTAARGLPVAWGVRTLHAEEQPVNVWVATTGSRVRIEGGRIDTDGSIVGDATDPAMVYVVRAVSEREAVSSPLEQLAVDSANDTGTIAP